MDAAQARRRTVTVLFSDLVGSTELGERLDPETVQDALDRYFASAKEAIERHGGLVEKFIGDAILAVFGFPNLHEDDALRGVRAALDMQEALALVNETLERDFDVQLHTRTGVNTGEVVTGDPSAGERLVTGDAVNVAARLEQTAPPDAVVIGETTFALVRTAVGSERLPFLRLKGKADDVVAYRVHSLAAEDSRETVPAAPFVDRERERDQIGRLLSEPGEGARQPIVVLGEAGIGKSRLVAEVLRTRAVTALQGRCLPYGDGITYWPIAQVLRRVGDIRGEDGEEFTRRKLRQAVADPVDEPVVLEPLVSLLSGSAVYPAEEVARAFVGYMEALATSRDVVLLIEDVHWAEPTLLDLVEHMARSGRVRVVCTARPEFADGADGSHQTSMIELGPLENEDTGDLLSALVGREVAPAVGDRLVESAGGNPFFLEQIISQLRDEGTLERAAGSLDEIVIPPSVAAVLEARLDGLPPSVRDVAERAAVVGQIFYLDAIEALGADDDVSRQLRELMSRGFIQASLSDVPGQTAFAFRHILIRDAVYRGTLKRRRAEWHERVCGWIEEQASEGEREEFIGFHLEQAHRLRVELGRRDTATLELGARASEALSIAGRRAADRTDAPAAAALLGRALALAPDEARRRRLLVDLAYAQLDAGSVSDALTNARIASERPSPDMDPAIVLRARVASMMVELHAGSPDLEAFEAEGEPIVDELKRLGESEALGEATLMMGIVAYSMGRMSRSAERLEQAAEIGQDARDEAKRDRAFDWLLLAVAYGPTPVPLAIARCEEVIRSTRPRSRVEAAARSAMAVLKAMALDIRGARADAGLARSIYEELGMPLEVAASSQADAVIEMLAGDPAPLDTILRSDGEELDAMDAHGYALSSRLRRAQVLSALGRHDEATAVAERAKAEVSEDDVVSRAMLTSVIVRSWIAQGRLDEAEPAARTMLEEVRGRDHWEVTPTALLDLAHVFEATGRLSDARGLLDEARRLSLAKGNEAFLARIETKIARLP